MKGAAAYASKVAKGLQHIYGDSIHVSHLQRAVRVAFEAGRRSTRKPVPRRSLRRTR